MTVPAENADAARAPRHRTGTGATGSASGRILHLTPNLTGTLLIAVSMAAFTFNDSIMKLASTEMNMGQAMFVRGIFATTLLSAIALHRGALASPRMLVSPMVLLRTVGELGGTLFFLLALAHLPLANVSSVMQALPLSVTMGAALVLGEPVGWRRWLAILAGFIGVTIIVRPGFHGFNLYALYALGAVACCTVRDLATRRLPPEVPSMLVSVAATFLVTVFGFFLVEPMGGWAPLGIGGTALLAAAACLVLVGYQSLIVAMRVADISFISPFRYTALLWAILLGFVLFGDFPDMPMIVGSVIVVASGLYMLLRERSRGQPLASGRIAPSAAGADT